MVSLVVFFQSSHTTHSFTLTWSYLLKNAILSWLYFSALSCNTKAHWYLQHICVSLGWLRLISTYDQYLDHWFNPGPWCIAIIVVIVTPLFFLALKDPLVPPLLFSQTLLIKSPLNFYSGGLKQLSRKYWWQHKWGRSEMAGTLRGKTLFTQHRLYSVSLL